MKRKKAHRLVRVAGATAALLAGLFLPRVVTACEDIYVFNLEKMLSSGDTLLVDVREPYEYNDCRIPGSMNVPVSVLSKRAAELDAKKTVIVYCASGRRSVNACDTLEKQGFKAYSLYGGIKAYYNTGGKLDGSCIGAPGFRYGKEGRPVRSDAEMPPPEPEIKGCK